MEPDQECKSWIFGGSDLRGIPKALMELIPVDLKVEAFISAGGTMDPLETLINSEIENFKREDMVIIKSPEG